MAGTGSYNEFITTNEYATQEIATNVYNTIKNYTHRPYEIINAIFDDNTILEVGDKFQINNTDYIFFEGRINYGNVISYDMTAPYDQEMIHEYPVTGQYLKEIKRKVSLGTNYYGTTIDRDNGLTIEREDGLSKVIMNSESMKWQVDKGAGLADRLYFDSVAGDLKYNGSLEIQQDDNKAKTIIDASETAIYGATGTAGALEKNFYVDSTGKIKVKNIELAGSMNLSVGSITWGDNNPVPSYIGATNIDMSSVTSPYVIAGSLQGSNFVHYPASTPGGLNVLGNAIRYINGWGSNIFQLPDEQVLTGFSVGSYVNVGPSAYSSAFISNAQISTFLDVTVWPATTTSTPTRTCLLNAAYFIPNDGNNTYPAYMSLASTESLGEPFVLYNVPITKHTDLSGYADNKIGGIKYENGGVVLNSVNGYSIKITSTGDVVITSSGVVLIDSPIVALSGRIISLTATSGYAYLNGQQIATV
ncbi:MAG: hypothetical protein BWY47_00171 [Bacteroidetes bacterium ADurb.Bin302]|nr:MAG: hypothetical protein BWY47_00171 [Bacteroidetes bacterium ADurb.Bin302]